MDEEKIEVLRSYPNIWNYRKKIYNIDTLKLFVPVAIEDACFFLTGLLIVGIFCSIFPFLNGIPSVIKVVLIPLAITKFLANKKLDGKKPHKFLWGYFKYALSPKRYAHFQPFSVLRNDIGYKPVAFRSICFEDMTATALKNLGKRRKKGHAKT